MALKPGGTAARGYGAAHQALRAKLLPLAYGTDCYRCGQVMLPSQELHLGHDDHDRTKYRGIEHAQCNVRAGAIKGNEARRARPRRRRRAVISVDLDKL